MTSTLEALQTTLAGEHAAVWIYGALGGQTSASAQPALFAVVTRSYLAHRGRRDQLIRAVRDLGVEPVASAVAYELPNDAATPARVNATAREVEGRAAAVYADLVASTYGDQRRWGIQALTDAAIRELAYRGSPEIFPGLGELTDR